MEVNESSTMELEETQSIKPCSGCKELSNEEKYCMNCLVDCCHACIDTSHKDHNVLPSKHCIVRKLKLFLADYCTLHKNEHMYLYCYTCKLPSCISCVGETHVGHSMSTIQSVAKQADSLYSELIDALAKAKSMHAKKKVGYDNYIDSVEGVITEIKFRFGKLRLNIEEMEASILEPLEKEINEVKKINMDKEKFLQETNYLADLFKSSSADDYVQKVAFVSNCPNLEKINFEEETLPEPVSFNPGHMNIPKKEDLIGSIERCSGQSLHVNESSNASIDAPVLEVISLKSIEDVEINGRVLPLSDGRKWHISYSSYCRKSGYSNYDISILDESLVSTYILKIQIQSKTLVPQVSIIGPSDLLYTSTEKVWRLSTSGSKTLILNTAPVTINGVCYTSDGRLVLGLSCESEENPRSLIRIYLLNDLKPLTEIDNNEDGVSLFTCIRSITENSNGDLIVHNNEDLLCINKQGRLRWELKKDFSLFCVDKFSNIVLATDDEIKVLDCNGKYVKTLMTKFDFLIKPTSLFIDTEGLLWIGQEKNVKVLMYWK